MASRMRTHAGIAGVANVVLFVAGLAMGCGSNASTASVQADGGGPDVGSQVFSEGNGDGAATQCRTDGECGTGGLCDPGTHTCGCGGTEVQTAAIPPNLLIAMDRSCSMTQTVAGTPKWTLAVRALTALTTTYAGKIRFGLTLFPDRQGTSCTQGTIPIPVGPGNEAAIQQALAGSLTPGDPNYPDGPCVTPIDAAMTQVETDPALTDSTRGDFALLITDGKQAACNAATGDSITVQAITKLASVGAHTFVVGFGSAVSVASLDSFAQAGGEVNPAGPNAFYNASDAPSLDSALGAIAQRTLSCTLKLSQTLPNGDPSLIFVYLNKTPPPVPRDATHRDGWDFDPATNEVTLYGTPCVALKHGQVQNAEVILGCKGGGVPTPTK